MRTVRGVLAAALLLVCGAAAQTPDARQVFAEATGALQRGDYGLAIQQFHRVLDLEPNFVPARVSLGIALVQVGQYAEAIESYQAALGLDPQNTQIKFFLALAQFKKGDAAGAARGFEELLKADPKNIRLRRCWRRACSRLEKADARWRCWPRSRIRQETIRISCGRTARR